MTQFSEVIVISIKLAKLNLNYFLHTGDSGDKHKNM